MMMEQQQQEHQLMDRRPDALGNLGVLPDEIICAFLENLEPPDLARLSCVSSVMYILCNEEPLWMSLCLRIGGLLEYKGSWKRTTLFRQNLCTITETSCQKSLQFHGFDSLFLYRRWYRSFTTLNVFSLDNGILERKKDLTMEEFRSDYDGKKPLLLTELAEEWPARKKWTKSQLLLSYGDVAFRLSQRSSKKITMKFKDYVSYMDIQHDEDPLYIFDDKFEEAAPSLLEDYSVPHLFQEDFFDVLDPDQRPPFRWLIIGPERSGASWHVDPALTSAWNTLLAGRKRWALYPPGRVPAGVTVHVNEEDGDVTIDSPSSLQWWLDIYPYLSEHDKPLECTQLPGETIFLPSGWWHCVLNLETTIAVTQNFVNATNFEYVCLDMTPGHRHKGVCRAGLLAVQENVYDDAKSDTSFNQMNHLDMTRKEKRIKLLEPAKDTCRNASKKSAIKGQSDICTKLQNEEFSYDIEFLAMFLDEDRNHYNCIWSPSNCIGPREMRSWLHRLWVSKPTMRQLIWKGACLALDANKWSACMMEICASNNLPFPSDEEKFPVGTGSNPVFLVSDYAIKIYVEGGLESSILGLGAELELYGLLHKVKSPLLNHVPDVMASGLVVHENGFFKVHSWDGREVPEVVVNCNIVQDFNDDGFSFGVWSKKTFELKAPGNVSCTNIWPYIVTKRCKGDIFAHLRDSLPKNDLLDLASFLGDQLRNLHLLPLPPFRNDTKSNANILPLTRNPANLVDRSENPTANSLNREILVPREWELVIATLDERKKNLKVRLAQWGDPIPGDLMENIEEYLPNDLALLLNLTEESDGLYKVIGSPTWIHSDIMDDNIHMEPCPDSDFYNETTSSANSTVSCMLDACNLEGIENKWLPSYILDFSNLSIGDPLFDVIPIYLDIFRGNVRLLKQFLQNYRLPLARMSKNVISGNQEKNLEKFKRTSYRAMCFCILHEDNILGAIFSLWKELKKVKSWEEVEEAVWGELNHYQCCD